MAFAVPNRCRPLLVACPTLVARRALFPTVRISQRALSFFEPRPKRKPFQLQVFQRVSHIRDLVPMPAMQARVLPVQLTRRTLANTSPVTGLSYLFAGSESCIGRDLKKTCANK
jgi:hypothetical protein